MKLKQLLSKNVLNQINEDVDVSSTREPPEIIFYVPTTQQVAKADSKTTDNYYTANDVDFSKMANIQTFTLTKDFIQFIKLVENAGRDGYNARTKTWFPHNSPEGGTKTIGYGHKIKSFAEQSKLEKSGLSDLEVENLLIKDLSIASRRAKEQMQRRFPGAILDQTQMEMLTEFAFNLGGLEKFPKFAEAVVKGNWDIAKKEYHRNYTDKAGNRQRLDRRNNAFYNRYLKNR